MCFFQAKANIRKFKLNPCVRMERNTTMAIYVPWTVHVLNPFMWILALFNDSIFPVIPREQLLQTTQETFACRPRLPLRTSRKYRHVYHNISWFQNSKQICYLIAQTPQTDYFCFTNAWNTRKNFKNYNYIPQRNMCAAKILTRMKITFPSYFMIRNRQ